MKEDEENCPASRTPCRFMIFFTIIALARIFLDIFMAISERNRNFVRKKPIKRKFMKKFFLVTLILLLPMVASAYDAYINGIFYNFSGTEAEVTSLEPEGKANAYFGAVEIPMSVTHEGTRYTVTSIGDKAFWGCGKVTSISIPKTVTKIGDWAFNTCAGLTSISIPKSITSVGNFAFSGCASLTHITIPNSVTSIGENAFAGCSELGSVTISEGVTSIGKEAFLGCLQISSITIPKSVMCIGENVFAGCIKLNAIRVDKNNTTYDSRDKCNAIIETATNTLIIGCNNTVIPNGVKSIGKAAFCSCVDIALGRHFKNIFKTLAYIHFSIHSGPKSIVIPDGVICIGEEAFSGCTNLTSIIIPNSLTTIGESAFERCYHLDGVTIPESVTSIGRRAFHNCDGLTSITIPNGMTTISDSTFYGCDSLTSVSIPQSVSSIGGYAFGNCRKLKSITIPQNVASIGESAFNGCIGLESIIVEKGNTTYDSRDNCNAIIETKTNTLIAGCGKTVIPNSVTSIGKFAFKSNISRDIVRLLQDMYNKAKIKWEYPNSSLTSIAIPEGVTSIGSGAFYDCFSLKDVTIPQSVTSIGDHAFHGCTGLTSFTIPDGVTTIGDSTFYGCESLTSISIPKSVTSIGFDAFFGCKELTSLEIPEGVTYINSEDNLGNDRIYETVDEIAQYPGGEAEGYKWLNGQIQYPADCLEQGVQGRVLVSLVIGKDGSIEEAKTVRSPHPSLSQEAERVFRMMPKWNPATQEGKPVRSRLIMPIMFKLKATDPDTIDKPHDPDDISTLSQ